MECRGYELRCKEIINMTDGSRVGYVGDVVVDLEEGKVTALVVPGRLRLFGLLGREPLGRIPFWWRGRRSNRGTVGSGPNFGRSAIVLPTFSCYNPNLSTIDRPRQTHQEERYVRDRWICRKG